jgi:hypothetical protein
MKHLVFVMMLCVTAGVHAKGGGGGGGHGGGGHASGHSSGSHSSSGGHSSSVPHIYSTGHPSFGKPMRVSNNYYTHYSYPSFNFPMFHGSSDDCKPPRKCEIKDYAPRF